MTVQAIEEARVTTTDAERRDALAERLFENLLGRHGAAERAPRQPSSGFTRHCGPAAPRPRPSSPRVPACTSRYAREWLEQQAVMGILDVAGDHDDAYQRRFALPGGHAEALLDVENPAFAASGAAGAAGARRCLRRRPARLPDRRPASRTATRARTSAAASAGSTARCSRTTSAAVGCPRCPRCTSASPRRAAPACSTSAVAPAGRRSRWPARTRTRRSTASTSMRPRSPRPSRTRRPPASPIA